MPDAEVVVTADARALGQILINLVGNAIKFTESGLVRIELQGPDGDASLATITVSDTGPGISDADLRGIFNAFERGSEATLTRKEGTGLGLYVSHKLAELITAEIHVESVPGSGTTFTVTFGTDDREQPLAAGLTSSADG